LASFEIGRAKLARFGRARPIGRARLPLGRGGEAPGVGGVRQVERVTRRARAREARPSAGAGRARPF
jgi:hypothetical protein